jgi:hypothetical protein
LVDALAPEFAQRWVRARVDDRRALTGIDAIARRGYLERIERQAREHAS